jgi:outer membrane protein assembly factor BamB
MRTNKILFAAIICLSLLLSANGDKMPLWKIQLAAESAGSPAMSAERTIVASRSGTLLALDGSGRKAWEQKLPGDCLSAPAVDRNGDIYVACANGSLLRFSSAGKQVWRIDLGQELLATPLLAAETLFAVGGDGRVCKIAKKNGAILKKAELNLALQSSPVWDADRKNLLLPAKDYGLVKLDQELRILWKYRTAGVNLSAPAVTPKNEIYLTSMDHHLYKLGADGRLLWKYKTRGWIKASPVIDEKGRVYFGCYDRYFYAVSAEGRLLWHFQGKAQFTAGAAIDEAGNLYCGDTSGTVYALNSGGKLSWQYKSNDFISADMTILPEKVLLAGSIDGTLLAFRIKQPMSHRAWWAKYLGNLANSGFDEQ